MMLSYVWILCLPVMARAESLVIARQFTPGSVRYIESAMDVQQKIAGSPMGEMNIVVRRVYGTWEKVESVQDGLAQLKVTFDRLAQVMDFPMWGNPRFDTDDPDDPESANLLRQVFPEIVGESFVMGVKGGKIVSFAGMDQISKKVSQKAIANAFWEQMKSEFTDEAGRQSWDESQLLFYPNKEVKIGETWPGTALSEQPHVGKMKTEYTYKLERLAEQAGRPTAVISFVGATSSVYEGAEPDPNAAKVTGTVKGEAVYDVKDGLVVGDKSTIDTHIKLPLPGTAGAEGGTQFLDVDVKDRKSVV